MTVQLNSEQLDWLMTLTRSEARSLIRALATGEWMLEWNDANHAFELKPA